MNKYLKRIAASVLTVSFGLSLMTACSHAGTAMETTVDDDSPWYNVRTVNIADDVDESDYVYRIKSFTGVVDDKVIFHIMSSYMPEDADEGVNTEELAAYDFEGNLISSVSLMDEFKARDMGEYINIFNVTTKGDSVSIISYASDENYNSLGISETLWNPTTGVLGETLPYTNSNFADVLGDDAPYRTFKAFDCTIEYYFEWNDDEKTYLLVADNSGSESLIDLTEQIPSLKSEFIYDIPVVIENGDNKALVCLGMASGVAYADLDLNTKTITLSQNDYSWLDNNIADIRNVEGLGSIVIDGDGISAIDLDNSTLVPIFSYDNCNVNRSVLDNLYPVMADEERVIMTGVDYKPCANGTAGHEDMILMIFEKADSNPNAGKTIIRIASISGYSYALCDAVCRFNDQSTEYFAVFDTRYELEDYAEQESVGYDGDTLNILCHDVNSNLGNQLSVDLLSGDGPDIIIGGSSYSQLNDPDYLVDLTDYVNSNCNDSGYFMNVIDSAKTDDALYQIPIAFSIAGITVPESEVKPGQRGFTFDEYNEFVSSVCNGSDPMSCGKTDFFIAVMNGMKDLMTDENGYINFDNDAFRALAGYTDEYVLNPLEPEGEDVYFSFDDGAPSELILGSLYLYSRRIIDEDKVFLGYPSYDGRGPLIIGQSSIGVSSQSGCVDGCLEFVSKVLGYECQRNFGCEFGLPVNREAFTAISHEYIEYYNRELTMMLQTSSEAELREMGMSATYADDSLIQSFTETVESLSGNIFDVDAPVDAIVLEEIPAFFEGQKSIDEVILVINDRARSVVDERL